MAKRRLQSGGRATKARGPALDFGDGRFLVEAVVGEGGTARVFRVRDQSSGKIAAVKLLRRSLMDSEEVVARFELEAELLGSFDHPNILGLLDSGRTPEGVPWFACPLAERGSLADMMLTRGPIVPPDLLTYAAETLDALQYLHGQGIVHRDVKPENVLVDHDDVALLCDFGISMTPRRRSTLLGDRMGTPSFMPPEQYADPASVTLQADLYGLGVTLFTALTGQTGMVLLVEHLRPAALASLPIAIARIVDRATDVRATNRYTSALEMALDVADVLEEW